MKTESFTWWRKGRGMGRRKGGGATGEEGNENRTKGVGKGEWNEMIPGGRINRQ